MYEFESLKITNLEKYSRSIKNDKYLTENMKNDFNIVKNGLDIDKDKIDSISRLVLREKLWCKFESKDMFVSFGWDYYMYIGGSKACEKYIEKIRGLGLFVEEYSFHN